MRATFLILIVANLVYFGWNYTQPPATLGKRPGPIPPGVGVLTLLRQPRPLGDAPSVAAATRRAAIGEQEGVGPGPARACYTLGPLDDQPAADELAARLQGLGLAVARRVIEDTERTAYWVHLAPLSSREAAEAMAGRLKERGVTDYFVVPSGENRYAVSLGLFSKEGGALRRVDEIAGLGLKPLVEVKDQNKTLYWVDYDETGTQRIPEPLWQSLIRTHGSIRRIPRGCG
jgi:hypothetical protein